MLIDEPAILGPQDPFLTALSNMTAGRPTNVRRLQQGIYLIGHFNGNYMLPRGQYEAYPGTPKDDEPWDSYWSSYGVCDSAQNLIDHLAILQDPVRQFVVTLTEVRHDQQHPEGGWRWHKWGEYIGKHEPQHEYLYDEVGIDSVFCYHVYERKT